MDLRIELVIRIVFACLCGAVIGVERTIRLKEAGIRTHTIVSMGAALIMVVSKYGFLDKAIYNGNFDASRIASCVVTGISFLCAGVIFVKDNSIKGLTTSAGIWATAGIGLSLGAGMYFVGFAATIVLALVQLVLHRFIGRLDSMTLTEVSLSAIYSPDIIDIVNNLFSARGYQVTGCHVSKNTDNTVSMKLTIKSDREIPFSDIAEIFEENENFLSFSI